MSYIAKYKLHGFKQDFSQEFPTLADAKKFYDKMIYNVVHGSFVIWNDKYTMRYTWEDNGFIGEEVDAVANG